MGEMRADGAIPFAFINGLARSRSFWNDLFHHVVADNLDVAPLRKVEDSLFVCRKAEGIGNPEDFRVGHQALALHLD